MTEGSSLLFPPSQVLSGWWKELALLYPKQVWVGYLTVYHVEAPVATPAPTVRDSLSLFILRALALRTPQTWQDLDRELHLGQFMLVPLLRDLAQHQLVEQAPGDAWRLGPRAASAIESNRLAEHRHSRRTFAFRQPQSVAKPPIFIDLRADTPWIEGPSDRPCHFDPAVLDECFQRSPDWKRKYGFPTELGRPISLASRQSNHAPSWHDIILVQPRCVPVVVVVSSAVAGREQLIGLSFTEEEWSLNLREPAFACEESWRERFTDLRRTLSPEEWRQSWRLWCQAHGLSDSDSRECALTPELLRLRVSAPAHVVDRVRTAVSKTNGGCLLAGDDFLRNLVRIDIEAMERRKAPRHH
jgi:hypothetical protein